MTAFSITREFAQQLDAEDKLHPIKSQFLFPKHKNSVRYFCGHSLGLQSKRVKTITETFLKDWAEFGVEGHWKGENPWLPYHEWFCKPLSLLTGAYPDEVVAMNSLSVNLHIAFASFYRPQRKRFKILTEYWNFSSDRFALESLVQLYGYDPKDAIITLKPKKGKYQLETKDILKAIEDHKNELAIVFFNGVNYYTGQAFDIATITQHAQRVGAFCGFDLAHAIGNIPLKLHDDRVDFAVWCSYKYLNGGPGAVGGLFIHQRHSLDKTTPRMAGWWGHELTTRFHLTGKYKALSGAAGFQMSNAPIMNMLGLRASLEVYLEAGINNLFEKSKTQYDYFVFLISSLCHSDKRKSFRGKIISPLQSGTHGAMVCIECENGKGLVELLIKEGYWCDWREPNVIRMAASPLYTSYSDIYEMCLMLSQHLIIEK
ncbi:MAG: kynureninase [Cytophagaceae bacterium]